MDVLVTPLEVMDNSLVSELLFNNKQILKKLHNAFIDVEVIELCDHCFLIFEVFLVRVY